MTCIIGVIDNGKVYMGADSLSATSDFGTRLRKDPKIFKKGKFIIGYTSSYRMGQILQYEVNFPKKHPDEDCFEYMVKKFILNVRSSFDKGGYMTVKDNEEHGGHFLVGFEGRLFHIQGDFQVSETAYDYDSTGCGEEYALGSLYSTKNFITDPKERITLALQASQEFSGGVREPFIILES